MSDDNSFKLLCFGADGQLGRDVVELVKQRSDITLIPITINDLDLTQTDKIFDFITGYNPDFIVNCAAFTSAELAEEQKDACYALNATAVGEMAKACQSLDIPLVTISTDYTLNGDDETPIPPSADADPQNYYGVAKLEGEKLAAKLCDKHLILRTSWLFGEYGPNFVSLMLRLGKERPEINVVDDQRGKPTSVRSLASVIMTMVDYYRTHGDETPWGLYHVSNSPATTWYGFTVKIFEVAKAAGIEFHPDLAVNPITSEEFPTKAPRPKYSIMDCQKTWDNFGIKETDWRDELEQLIHKLDKS